jgi:hypothetical protein
VSDEVNFEAVARWLYDVLDDIDTASDHAKGDDVKYRKTVERLQQLRHEVGRSLDGYTVTFRNPSEAYGLTRLWHPCTPTPWPDEADYPPPRQP